MAVSTLESIVAKIAVVKDARMCREIKARYRKLKWRLNCVLTEVFSIMWSTRFLLKFVLARRLDARRNTVNVIKRVFLVISFANALTVRTQSRIKNSRNMRMALQFKRALIKKAYKNKYLIDKLVIL